MMAWAEKATGAARARPSRHRGVALGRAALLAAAALVAGCGFQLRAWELTGTFHVVGEVAPALDRAVRRALKESGAAIATSAAGADIVLRLADEREARRGVSLTPGGRVAEYELALSVAVVAEGAGGAAIVPRRVLRAERVYSLDVNNLVGSREEEALILGELRTLLAQRIVRNLVAATGAR